MHMESYEGAPTFEKTKTQNTQSVENSMWELSGQMYLNLLFMAILTFLLETNKQKEAQKDWFYNFFSTGANTTRQKVSTSRRSVGIFAEKIQFAAKLLYIEALWNSSH